jgi:tetratricopeptide (TPR) repeat protein
MYPQLLSTKASSPMSTPHHRARRLLSTLTLLLALCVSVGLSPFSPPSSAFADAAADEDARFEALISDALRAYTEGDYEKAIDIYFKAKVMRNLPAIDYSIARCYHKLNKCSAAKNSYDRVLNRPANETPQELIDKSRAQLEELKTCQEAKDAVVAVDPPKADPPKTDTTVVTQPKVDPPKTDDSGKIDWLAIGLMSGGGALVLAGLGVDLGSASLTDDYNYYNTDPTSGTNAERRAKVDSLSSDITTRKVAVWSLYGAGAAALITGVVFLLLPEDKATSGLNTSPSDTSLADRLYLQPALNPDGAGLLLGGSF